MRIQSFGDSGPSGITDSENRIRKVELWQGLSPHRIESAFRLRIIFRLAGLEPPLYIGSNLGLIEPLLQFASQVSGTPGPVEKL